MRSGTSALEVKETIKKSIIWWITFFITVWACVIVYWALTNLPSKVWTWSWLTASSWNTMVDSLTELDGKIATLNTAVNNITVPQFLWQAEQNVDLVVNDNVWKDIPWTSVSFNLTSPKKIWTTAHWAVMAEWTNIAWYSHTYCSFRFNIDWVSYWDANRWNQIIWCWSEASWYWNRCNWNMEKVMDLATWNHTVKIQMRGYWTNYYSCRSTIYDYGRARLFVETKN